MEFECENRIVENLSFFRRWCNVSYKDDMCWTVRVTSNGRLWICWIFASFPSLILKISHRIGHVTSVHQPDQLRSLVASSLQDRNVWTMSLIWDLGYSLVEGGMVPDPVIQVPLCMFLYGVYSQWVSSLLFDRCCKIESMNKLQLRSSGKNTKWTSSKIWRRYHLPFLTNFDIEETYRRTNWCSERTALRSTYWVLCPYSWRATKIFLCIFR